MILHVLGSAGWIPYKGGTSCFMAENGDDLFILDAGTGIANLRSYATVLSKYSTVNILLTHYHLDHTIGLIYLLPYINNKKLRIYGPGKMAYPETNSYYVRSLLRKEFFSRDIDSFTSDVQLHDFPSGCFRIGGTQIKTAIQKHASPSVWISLDDKLVYATDTDFDASVWQAVHARILLHECWDYNNTMAGSHTTLQQILTRLPRENFERVILIHHNPAWEDADYENIRKLICGTNIILAEDGMQFDI